MNSEKAPLLKATVAEREGFEPPVDTRPTPVFKTGAFDRSATSPAQTKAF